MTPMRVLLVEDDETLGRQVADNLRRLMAGQPLHHVVSNG